MGRIKKKGRGTDEVRERIEADRALTRKRKETRKAELRTTSRGMDGVVMLNPIKKKKVMITKPERVPKGKFIIETSKMHENQGVVAPDDSKFKEKNLALYGKRLTKLLDKRKVKAGTDQGKAKLLKGKSLTQQPRAAQMKSSSEWDKSFTKLSAAVQERMGVGFEESDPLSHWLFAQRKEYDTEMLAARRQNLLGGLDKYGFNWLHASFRRKRFEKSLEMRSTWIADRLAKDRWLSEHQSLLTQGLIPPDYVSSLENLLARL